MITQINTAAVSRHDSTAGDKKQPYSGHTRKTMQSYVIEFDKEVPEDERQKFTILCIILIILLAAFAVYMVLRQQ